MNAPDLFTADPAPEPEDGCFSLRRYGTCDLCDTKEAPGDLHHHRGVPVLFIGDCCAGEKSTPQGNDEVPTEVPHS